MNIIDTHRTLVAAITEGGPHDALVTFGDLVLIADKMASWLGAQVDPREDLFDDDDEDMTPVQRMAAVLVEQTDRNNRLVGEIADLQRQLRAFETEYGVRNEASGTVLSGVYRNRQQAEHDTKYPDRTLVVRKVSAWQEPDAGA
ncbi:MAG: hypothetical protein HOV97_05505 [Nonomuraea sp.]|nr:hypothetical protein [Nonomuraea sp.]